MLRWTAFLMVALMTEMGLAVTCPDDRTRVVRGDGLVPMLECADGERVGVADAESFPGIGCADDMRSLKGGVADAAVSVYAEKYTSPALHVMTGDKVCYISLVEQPIENTLVVLQGERLYYATDVEMCLTLNPSGGATLVPSQVNATAWAGDLDGVTVRGVSHCSGQTGDIGVAVSSLSVSSTVTENMYCYCRVVVPVVSDWFFGMEFASSTNCNMYCAARCAEYFAEDASFREVLFSDVYMLN